MATRTCIVVTFLFYNLKFQGCQIKKCFHNIFIGQLQINDSQESDQGKYECVAENNVGSQYSYSAQLYVRGT